MGLGGGQGSHGVGALLATSLLAFRQNNENVAEDAKENKHANACKNVADYLVLTATMVAATSSSPSSFSLAAFSTLALGEFHGQTVQDDRQDRNIAVGAITLGDDRGVN